MSKSSGKGLLGDLRPLLTHPPFQWQKAKCVTHCAPLGDAGAQAPVSAYLAETTAEEVSV